VPLDAFVWTDGFASDGVIELIAVSALPIPLA
jgi:hypothetical protein